MYECELWEISHFQKSLISPFSISGKFHPGTRQFFCQQVPSVFCVTKNVIQQGDRLNLDLESTFFYHDIQFIIKTRTMYCFFRA